MNKRSFTLVEMMIIVAVIGVLTAIAIPNLIKAKMSANDVAAQAGLRTIATALENYLIFNSSYPASVDALTGGVSPYLGKNYFSGTHSGFTFDPDIQPYSYIITADPVEVGKTGTTTFTITTGAVFQNN
ncbi:MAG: prepilin-type N-terminal cleavage/methylation domain-containing protein [Candidatus Omnitrophota bacterium]